MRFYDIIPFQPSKKHDHEPAIKIPQWKRDYAGIVVQIIEVWRLLQHVPKIESKYKVNPVYEKIMFGTLTANQFFSWVNNVKIYLKNVQMLWDELKIYIQSFDVIYDLLRVRIGFDGNVFEHYSDILNYNVVFVEYVGYLFTRTIIEIDRLDTCSIKMTNVSDIIDGIQCNDAQSDPEKNHIELLIEKEIDDVIQNHVVPWFVENIDVGYIELTELLCRLDLTLHVYNGVMFTILYDIYPFLRLCCTGVKSIDDNTKKKYVKYPILRSRLIESKHNLMLGDIILFVRDCAAHTLKISSLAAVPDTSEKNKGTFTQMVSKILKGGTIIHIPMDVKKFIDDMVDAMKIIRQYELSHPEQMPLIFQRTPHDRVKIFPRPTFTDEHIDIMIKHYDYIQTFMTKCKGVTEYKKITPDMSPIIIEIEFMNAIDAMHKFFPNFVKLKKAGNIYRDKPQHADKYEAAHKVFENALRKTMMIKTDHMLPKCQEIFVKCSSAINRILTEMDIYDYSEENHETLINISHDICKFCNDILAHYLEPLRDITIVYCYIPLLEHTNSEISMISIILDKLTKINDEL